MIELQYCWNFWELFKQNWKKKLFQHLLQNTPFQCVRLSFSCVYFFEKSYGFDFCLKIKIFSYVLNSVGIEIWDVLINFPFIVSLEIVYFNPMFYKKNETFFLLNRPFCTKVFFDGLLRKLSILYFLHKNFQICFLDFY